MAKKLIYDSPREILKSAEDSLSLAKLYFDKLKTKGITEGKIKRLEGLVSKSKELLSSHETEVGRKESLTVKQNKSYENLLDWIRDVQGSVKLAYKGKEEKKKEFRIGEKIDKTVEQLLKIGLSVYISAKNNLEELKERGIDKNSLREGDLLIKELDRVNAEQESTKESQVRKRINRDKSFREMVEIENEIREAGKIVFRKEKEIRDRFKKSTTTKNKKSEE